MDFNPDEAIAAGWLRNGSPAARFLEWMSRFSLNQARTIIALDRFLRDRIVAKGIAPEKVVVLPPWSHDSEVKFDIAGREVFRKAHGLENKFVVMYSGNHSPCHPLDTLLGAAEQIRSDPDIVFCFIGGGSEFRKIQHLVETRKAEIRSQVETPKHQRTEAPPSSDPSSPNLLCLSYQPLNALSSSLSAADLHVVVMGDPFVGLVHPCKIYNILSVAAPVLYIGPQPSHLSEMISALDGKHLCSSAAHGEVADVLQSILRLRAQSVDANRHVPTDICARFSKETIL